MLEALKAEVCAANCALETSGLVKLTWGNVSGIDRASGLWCIKPSGVAYAALKPDDMVVLDLEGKVVSGKLRPSSDTKTHLHFYQSFPEIGGITSYEAQVMLRSLRGMDFVGADLVEVSPPLDASGTTALVAANLAFEMLCLLADRVAAR